MSYAFREPKANFYLGLTLLLISIELLFSWGSYSGYNVNPDAFPFWIFKTYYFIPPSIWLYSYHTFSEKKFKAWHILLFIPAIVEVAISILTKYGIIGFEKNLMEYPIWLWYIDYIPLGAFLVTLGLFWIKYFSEANQKPDVHRKNKNLKLLLLMGSFSLIAIGWLVFSFVGWQYYWVINYTLMTSVLMLSFLIFLDSQPFPTLLKRDKNQFEDYCDEENLKKLETQIVQKQLFTNPELSLKTLSKELNLPSRYVSNLINLYHQKNFKDYINDFRVEFFLEKVKSPESKQKTILALALESGFHSKSTFNQVFKKKTGKVPSAFLH